MATKTTEKVNDVTYDPFELVPFKASKSREDKSDIYVSVNGQNFQIKRGEEVMIPRNVREVLENQQRMDDIALDRIDAMKEE